MSGPTEAEVLDALASVRDPELDESITDLGFVASVGVDGGRVRVSLRLPTFFCAPNFAYMMAADAQEAVAAVPGVASATVRLLDHFADAEISGGLAAGASFAGTFSGQTIGDDLDELRVHFARKAYLAATHGVCQALRAAGHAPETIVQLCLRDLPADRSLGDVRRRFLARRAELGLPTAPEAPLLLDVWGQPVAESAVTDHLRRARTVAVSIEGNAGFCRGLLATRYASDGTGKEEGRAVRLPRAHR